MSNLSESLLRCRVEGNVVYLPPITEAPLSNYTEVRSSLLKAGAIYKKNTFVFKSDAQPFIDRLCAGGKVNPKKEFQYFRTPDIIADRLVDLTDIKLWEWASVLEPSAGDGSLIEAVLRCSPQNITHIHAVELMAENLEALKTITGVEIVWPDFMTFPTYHTYDFIFANPPFTKGQDVDHLMKMYTHLNDIGTVACITSIFWLFHESKKYQAFRKWIDPDGEIDILDIKSWTVARYYRPNGDRVYVEKLAPGTFKESGTSIPTCIVVIEKSKS